MSILVVYSGGRPMIPGGFSPTERPKTAEEYEMESRPGRAPSRSGGKGVWIALGVVVLLVIAMVVLLSMIPEG
jgi:hypothetical protein